MIKLLENEPKENVKSFEDSYGFSLKSDEPKCLIVDMTPDMANCILQNHNNNNRQMCQSQVSKIRKSVLNDGWVWDGNPWVFDRNGQAIEMQHRATVISQDPLGLGKYKVLIVLGANPDAFSNTAISKQRRPHDEIFRKDNTVDASQSAILNDIMKRKEGDRLNINNAVKNWFVWKEFIVKGEKLCNSLMTNTVAYSSQKKTIGAWASFAVQFDLENESKLFLELLEDEIVKNDGSCCLTEGFRKYWRDHTSEESNEGRLSIMFKMLCVALDRIIEDPNGEIEFNMTPSKIEKLGGCYRKFTK